VGRRARSTRLRARPDVLMGGFWVVRPDALGYAARVEKGAVGPVLE